MSLAARRTGATCVLSVVKGLAIAMAIAVLAAPLEAREPRQSPWEELTPEEPVPAETSESVPYRVEFLGVEESGLLSVLRAASQLIELQNRPPPTAARLNVRVTEDLTRLDSVLRSEGYYDATARSEIDSDQSPAVVAIRIETGVRYRLANYDVIYEGLTPPPEDLRPSPKQLGLEPDMPARGPRTSAAGERWILATPSRGPSSAGP